MLTVKHLEAFNFEGALRGMRNPLESYHKSDSTWKYATVVDQPRLKEMNFRDENGMKMIFDYNHEKSKPEYIIGPNDMGLAQRLIRGGTEHSKFLRQIFVCMDITASIAWWKEMDTYKVGTVANSTSTMHTITKKPLTRDAFGIKDFSTLSEFHAEDIIQSTIDYLETLRQEYNDLVKEGKAERAKEVWRLIIDLLPESFLQTRTWSSNYAGIRHIIPQRRNHKQVEWHEWIAAMEDLPYAEELIFYNGE